MVAGHVQGVWYRASAQNRAAQLSLDGWARNLSDGRVEIVVTGAAEAVAEFCSWLWEGSPAARVDSVTVEAHEQAVQPGFDVA